MKASEIASFLGGKLVGDDVDVEHIKDPEYASGKDIAFVFKPKKSTPLQLKAGLIILQECVSIETTTPVVYVKDIKDAFI